jgi:glycosidase
MTIARALAPLLLAAAIALAAPAAHAETVPAPPARAETAPASAAAGEETFYHVFLRSFRDSNGDRIGDLEGLTQRLDYLKDLGVTSILLTPLQPSPFYHNYFATDFEGIEPAYGTMESYFAFVRAAHARGLKVYLDQEIQYVAEGHPWLTRSRGRADAPFGDHILWRGPGHQEPEPFLNYPAWQGYDGRYVGIAMIDMRSRRVKDYFERLLLFWADPHGDGSGRDGVDGFRIDHMMDDLDHKGLLKNLFAGFWAPIFAKLKARRPGFRILAEQADWGFGEDWLRRGHADLVFAFPLRGAILKLDKAAIAAAVRETDAKTPAGKGQIVFLENHDTDRLMSLVGGDPARARAAAAIALLLKGEPMLYYGQELGMRGKVAGAPLSDAVHIPLREAFRWSSDLEASGSAIWYKGDRAWWRDRFNRTHDGVSLEEQEGEAGSLYGWYRHLLALRRDRPELRGGAQQILCSESADILCILRRDGARHSLFAVNLSGAEARIPAEPAIAGRGWKDLSTGDSADPSGLLLRPLEVRIFGTP